MSASREKKNRKVTKTGGTQISAKQKQARQDAFRRTIAITVASVLLFALVVLIVSGSGIMQANLAAMKFGDVAITSAEFDFHYFLSYYQTYSLYESYGWLDYLNIDTSKSLKQQNVDETTTWAQYFEDMAVESLTTIVAQSEAAKREGIALTNEDIKLIDDAVASIEASAADNNLTPDRFLRNNYGRGITLKSYRAFLERSYLSNRYETTVRESYQRSEADLQSYYEENRTSYDYVDYHTFTISAYPSDFVEPEEGLSDEEREAIRSGQRTIADEMLSRVTTSEAFFALSKEYAEPVEEDADTEEDGTEDSSEDSAADDEEDDAAPDVEADTTLIERLAASSVTEALSEFLLDANRKAGDKTVVEDGDKFIVLLFVDRYRDEEKTVDVRHILFNFDDFDTNEEAFARAEEILEEWKSGAATSESFAALAEEYSSDGGSNTNGGLYDKLSKDTSFVEPFKEWYLDKSRKVGDTGIVETEYGYHIMYLDGYNAPLWQVNVKNDMDEAEYTAHLDSLKESQTYKRNWFGMLFSKSKTS